MSYTASIPLRRSRIALSLPLLMGLAAFLLILRFGTITLGDPDVQWHVALGNWILANHAVPHADFLSATMPGRPWVVHEWLSEIVLALGYDALGWHGSVILAALTGAWALAILNRALLRTLEPVYAILLTAGGGLVLATHWFARPHMLAMPLLMLWMTALVDARREGRAPAPALALLMILWANLHGGFLIGIGFAGLFLVEAVLASSGAAARLAAVKGWGLFLVAAFAATLVTPNGIDSYLLTLSLSKMSFTLSSVGEWKSPNFQGFQPLLIWLIVMIGAGFAFGIKLPWMRLLMILALFQMTMSHARYAELLVLLTPLLAAPSIAERFQKRAAPPQPSRLDRVFSELAGRPNAAGVVLVFLIAIAGGALAQGFTMEPPPKLTPAAAVAAARAARPAGRVLNSYGFGGYLISVGVKTYIDGRSDVFGDAFLKRFVTATSLENGELPKILDEDDIAWTLLEPDSPAVVLLDHLPGWHRLYADDVAVVHVRDP